MALVSKAFGDIITFTRASTATYFDATGTLQSAAIDTPRFDYNPATLAARGFLIEEARTNRIANTVVSGSISIGTGSAIGPNGQPMNKAIIGSGAVSFPQLGVGSGNAQSFTLTAGQSIDVALSGWFAAGTAGMIIEPRLIADFRTAPSTNFTYAEIQINTSTWTVRSKTLGVDITEVSAPSITLFSTGVYRVTWVVRYTQGATIRDTSGLYIQLRDSTGSGTFTGDGIGNFQYFGLQGETGSFPTSVIPTTTTALTRSADVASVNTLSPWFNATESTLYLEFTPVGMKSVGGTALVSIDNGATANERIALIAASNNGMQNITTVAGVTSGNSTTPGTIYAANTTYKIAMAVKLNDIQSFVGGAAGTAGTTALMPSGLTNLQFNKTYASATSNNGWIRRFTYYPRRLSAAEGAAITA